MDYTYHDIYVYNVLVMSKLLKRFGEEMGWEILSTQSKQGERLYIDPDRYAKKDYNGIECTADGLLSINRIYFHENGFKKSFISTYKIYREVPIFFFPPEQNFNGINSRRQGVFNDRIDHTLFDLKNWLSGDEEKRKNCRLTSAYRMEQTSKWLEKIGSFENYIDSIGVKGIFTDKYYNVYDLESRGAKGIIKKYGDNYSAEWTSKYYVNVKKKIKEYVKKQ